MSSAILHPTWKEMSVRMRKDLVTSCLRFIGVHAKVLLPGIAFCGAHYGSKPLHFEQKRVSEQNPSHYPLISIAIPSYNQGVFLERAIESLLSQAYPHLEILVVDGGSRDDSREIIERYSRYLRWWCSETDAGQAHALNKGFRRSRGEIMGWLNSDDRLVPGALGRISEFLSDHPTVDAVYGHRVLIDENDMEVGRWTLPPHDSRVLTWADYVPQETLFWRRRLWEKVGGKLDENLHFAMDWDLLLRFREAGAKMVRLPSFIGLFRVHERQKTSAEIHSTGFHEMQQLRVRSIGYTPSQQRVALGVFWYMIKAKFVESLWKAGIIHYD
jgi:glycosyltransferase involved in cell wall biosynthesis